MEHKLAGEEIGERVEHVSRLVEEITAQRAEDRLGERVDVLVEQRYGDGVLEGRAAHQGPEVDGTTMVRGATDGLRVGDLVPAVVTGAIGVDLVADMEEAVA
jgi:tRNA A37 methylthiotransferase MiaB